MYKLMPNNCYLFHVMLFWIAIVILFRLYISWWLYRVLCECIYCSFNFFSYLRSATICVYGIGRQKQREEAYWGKRRFDLIWNLTCIASESFRSWLVEYQNGSRQPTRSYNRCCQCYDRSCVKMSNLVYVICRKT